MKKEKRDIRALTRLREKLVNERTDHKNRVHNILDSACIRLATFFSDLFGKKRTEDSQIHLIWCPAGRDRPEIT